MNKSAIFFYAEIMGWNKSPKFLQHVNALHSVIIVSSRIHPNLTVLKGTIEEICNEMQ